MDEIPHWEASHLEAVCKVLGDTQNGLTGAEIGYILADMKLSDLDSDLTKWKRLYNALARAQNKHKVGNHVIMFINRAMKPVKYVKMPERFDWLRDSLNVVLAFAGYSVRNDGKVVRTNRATTIADAKARAGRLKSILEARGTHEEVFKYCRAELLEDNYFHAVLEAAKGLTHRVRELSSLDADGAQLIDQAFMGEPPSIAFNTLRSQTERSEHRGVANLMRGLFGAIRNPLAHEPRVSWPMPEQDAIDIFALISFIHRKLDGATLA